MAQVDSLDNCRQEARRTVLHVIDTLAVGGAQQLLVLLARYASPEWRTAVCVLQSDDAIAGRLEAQGVRVEVLGLARPSMRRPWKVASYMLGATIRVARLCRALGAEVVHCHLSDAELVGIPAGRLASARRVLATVHTPAMLPERCRLDPRNLLRVSAMWILYRLAHSVVAVSNQTAEGLRRLYGLRPPRLDLVLNGIDTKTAALPEQAAAVRRELGLGVDDFVVLNVGRLAQVKGQIHLVEAAGLLAKRGDRLRVLIAGDGPVRAELETAIERLGLRGRVLLLGERNDIPALIAASNAACFPSLHEGTSLALLETMAGGKPVVATDIAGTREVLDPTQALLVPMADPMALAEALAHLLDSPEERVRLSREARRAAEKLDIRRTTHRYEELWS